MHILTMLISLVSLVKATTVSYRLQPHERACFFADIMTVGEKVQEGGNFDIDYEIIDPNHKTIFTEVAQRQGDFVFAAKTYGEYQFCFSNAMSTFAEKLLDFDISIEHELTGVFKTELEKSVGKVKEKPQEKVNEQLKMLSSLITSDLSDRISTLDHMQRRIRTNEHRNFSVVSAAGSRFFKLTRIIWFAVVESLAMVGMAVLQVYAIQMFFAKGGRVRV